MKPRIHCITLAVDDIERSLTFYGHLWEIMWNPKLSAGVAQN
jgi:catechol 2,3-dioxygenase-like lactoylglutathione lyase family enzyme